MLCSRTLLFIYSTCTSLPLLIPHSQSIPSLALSPLATTSLFSHALPFWKQRKLVLSFFFLHASPAGSLLSRASLAPELHPSHFPLIASEEEEDEEREDKEEGREEKKTKLHPLPLYEQARLPGRVSPGNIRVTV